MNLKVAHIVKTLNEQTAITIQKQEENFIKNGYGCRATFYNYRKRLGLKSKTKKYGLKNKKGICYFCLNPAIDTHHIDKNRKNNRKSNKLNLCRSCHNKLHRVYNSLKNLGLKV